MPGRSSRADWALFLAVVVLTAPAAASQAVAGRYLLVSGVIFTVELIIAGRISGAFSSQPFLSAILAIVTVLWIPVWYYFVETLPPSLHGMATLVVAATLSALFFGTAFAHFTQVWRALPWVVGVSAGAAILASVNDWRMFPPAVYIWHVAIVAGLTSWARGARGPRPGFCPHCSYDLRGLPPEPDGRTTCPECGQS